MKALLIAKDEGYYCAIDKDGKVVLGGEFNAGGVDGTNIAEVVRVAVKEAEVVYIHEMIVVPENSKEKTS